MYSSLRRRGGSKRLVEARARRVPADLHEGTAVDFLRQHEHESAEAARGTKQQRTEFAKCLFRRVADSRNLWCAVQHVATAGGKAPGPNGLKLDQLDGTERWELARALSRTLKAGTYRPGSARAVQIPKGSGRGTRTLRLRNVQDRVVDRAIVQVVQPLLDPGFAESSFGFRPGKNPWHALAAADTWAAHKGTWAWVMDDIRNAFDNVPLGRLHDIVKQRLVAHDIVELIRIATTNKANRGLRQGSGLSPLLLNLYLDHMLDRPWRKEHPANPLLRYADDLLVLAQTRTEATELHHHLRTLVQQAGMNLKAQPNTTLRDLDTGEAADWLGFRVLRGPEGLRVQPTDQTWDQLRDGLERAHTEPNSAVRANESIVAWTAYLGPCWPELDVRAVYSRITHLAKEYSFEELPQQRTLEDQLHKGHRKWQDLRTTLFSHMDQHPAAPPAPSKIR